MKKILFLLLFIPAVSKAQTVFPIDSASQKITYSEVVPAKGSKVELFNKALEWFALTFKSSNDVIQIKDKDLGKIVGKWNLKPVDDRSGIVSCNITVLVKDEKYKYIVTDLYYQGTGEFNPWPLEESPSIWKANMTKGSQNKIKGNTAYYVKGMIGSLKSAMEQAAKKEDF